MYKTIDNIDDFNAILKDNLGVLVYYSNETCNVCIVLKPQIIEMLKPHLLKLGLTFVGVDIIGDYLIEVNVTSPTCVQEINRLNELALEEKVIDFVEEQILIVNS